MANLTLIVGLGNPGQQYAKTRHNAGFWFVEKIANQFNIPLKVDKKYHSLTGKGLVHDVPVRLLLPTTFMNKSGQAIVPFVNFYDISNDTLLVAHDELALDAGIIKLKTGGGHGGHNGLRDIIPHIGNDFHRLRIGIGHPGDKSQVSGHVLSKASINEQTAIDNAINTAVNCLPNLVTGRIDSVKNRLNGLKPEKST